jgi:hypothetical protein
MPTYAPEQFDDMELQQLVAFIKALKTGKTPTRNVETPAPENKDEGRKSAKDKCSRAAINGWNRTTIPKPVRLAGFHLI